MNVEECKDLVEAVQDLMLAQAAADGTSSAIWDHVVAGAIAGGQQHALGMRLLNLAAASNDDNRSEDLPSSAAFIAAAALTLQAGTTTAALHLSTQQLALWMHATVAIISVPPQQLFTDLTGAASFPDPAQQDAMQEYFALASAALQLLRSLLLAVQDHQAFLPPDKPVSELSDHLPSHRVKIVELLPEAVDDQRDSSSTTVPVADIVKLCSTYGTDPHCACSYTSPAVAQAAESALRLLAQRAAAAQQSDTHSRSPTTVDHAREGEPNTFERQACSSAVQVVVADVLAEFARDAQRIIVQGQPPDLNKARLEPHTGPDVFTRAVAAKQLTWLLTQLTGGHLQTVAGVVLPAVLAAVNDISPAVQTQGLWALHHLATEGGLAAVSYQRDLLLHTVQHRLAGCDEQTWPAASATAVTVVCALEGPQPCAGGYALVCTEMLSEGERHAHQPSWRITWLQAMVPLIKAQGLMTVRHFSRLMPLLLDWLHAPDTATRIANLELLHCVIQHTWPRMPAHATVLLTHLRDAWEALGQDAAPSGMHSSGSQDGSEAWWIERTTELLYWCGGSAAQDDVRKEAAASRGKEMLGGAVFARVDRQATPHAVAV